MEIISTNHNISISNNVKIIQILEEKQLNSYEKVFKESIKCHHNDIADYIQKKIIL